MGTTVKSRPKAKEQVVEARPRRQGEVLLLPVAAPPDGAEAVDEPVLGEHHRLKGGKAVSDSGTFYLQGGSVIHEHGDHSPLPLEGDLWYEAIIQREWVREARRVAD